LQQLDTATTETIKALAQNEKQGIEFALSYLEGRRIDEMRKVSGIASLNHYKGYIPSEKQDKGELIIESMDPKNHARLLEMSYQFVRPYGGSNLDGYAKNLGYYYLPVPHGLHSSRASCRR
jgi:hypothetical protein